MKHVMNGQNRPRKGGNQPRPGNQADNTDDRRQDAAENMRRFRQDDSPENTLFNPLHGCYMTRAIA